MQFHWPMARALKFSGPLSNLMTRAKMKAYCRFCRQE